MDRQPRDTFRLTDLPALLREEEVAGRWGKSLRTLQRWRHAGMGPAYIRIGGTVFYRLGRAGPRNPGTTLRLIRDGRRTD